VGLLVACSGLTPEDPSVPAAPVGDADAGAPADDAGGPAIVDAGAPTEVTWYKDVLPVAQRRCMSCHRGGGIGTFSMEDATTAQSLAASMAAAVYEGTMPPWPPSTDCRPLHNARLIEPDEVDLFVRWADDGAPLGDEADAPPPLGGPAGLDDVDAELALAEPYVPSFGQETDDYRCFILDPQLQNEEHIVAVEYAPDRGDMVHHVLLYRASRSAAQAKDDDEEGPGWTCFGGPGVGSTQGFEAADTLGAWAPGVNVARYPEGTGVSLTSDDVIVIQIHYNGENVWQEQAPADQTGIKLQYADTSVQSAILFPGPVSNFAIPPGAVDYEASDAIQLANISLPISVNVYGVLPHMHKLGSRIKLTATALDNSCLIDIPRWDFDWQEAYWFADGPLQLPLSGDVTLTCAWDNPTDQTVTWGEGTNDEMCLVYVYIVL
jgi:hypothetical protein